MATTLERFRDWITVGDHDGHHAGPCDVCQVIELAANAFPGFAVGYVRELLTAETERLKVEGP